MTGRRPGGAITPLHAPWATTGLQWFCLRPDGSECNATNGLEPAAEDQHNPEQAPRVWKAARAHRDQYPDKKEHRIIVERFQRTEV